jgi:hypothetical protein
LFDGSSIDVSNSHDELYNFLPTIVYYWTARGRSGRLQSWEYLFKCRVSESAKPIEARPYASPELRRSVRNVRQLNGIDSAWSIRAMLRHSHFESMTLRPWVAIYKPPISLHEIAVLSPIIVNNPT